MLILFKITNMKRYHI